MLDTDASTRKYVRTANVLYKYIQDFDHIMLEAAKMSSVDKITWFLNGLDKPLRAECQTDSLGNNWKKLRSLIGYAHGTEKKLLAAGRLQYNDHGHRNTNKTFAAAFQTAKQNSKQTYRRHSDSPSTSQGWQRVERNNKRSNNQNQHNTNTKRPKLELNHFGDPDAFNEKFPHLRNGEVVYRRNFGHCCWCNEKGHISKDCKQRDTPGFVAK